MARGSSWSPDQEQGPPVADDSERWQRSNGVLFGVLSSLLLWSLIIAGVRATLT